MVVRRKVEKTAIKARLKVRIDIARPARDRFTRRVFQSDNQKLVPTQIHFMKTPLLKFLGLILLAATSLRADPQITSWFTTYSGQYARVYTNDAKQVAGAAQTTWSNGSQTQSLPAYDGVQEIYSSSNWVYFRTTGLGTHIMGPWQNGSFPNLPANQKVLYRIPRTPTVTVSTNLTGLGSIGYFVDGVAMFDSRDGFVWTGSTESGSGTGYWNRDAYVNEGATFDPAYAHQQQTGTYHYHANPIALRYRLGDHVDYFASTNTYRESTGAATKHSPLLGWVADGYPIYGPYGYSNALDSASPVILMRSGFQLRNGDRGTDNLTNTIRTNLPAWAVRLYKTNSAGPSNLATYPVGRYMEDKAYLGDLTNSATGTNFVQGKEFDLDEHGGRYCVTPEFPGGTYAYFVCASSNGTPVFPYNIGRAYYGVPNGGSVTTISETVATNFLGGTNSPLVLAAPNVNNGTVTLTWSAVEGGSYRMETTTNFTGWSTLASNLAPQKIVGGYTNVSASDARFYRAALTGVASFDSAGTTTFSSGGGGGNPTTNAVAPGGNATRGVTVAVTITLPTNPPQPPLTDMQNNTILPSSITLAGTITGASITRPAQGTVVCNFTLPANGPMGLQDIVIVFPPPPNQTQGANYTLTGGFTINP